MCIYRIKIRVCVCKVKNSVCVCTVFYDLFRESAACLSGSYLYFLKHLELTVKPQLDMHNTF